MEEFIELKRDITEVKLMPPLTWAYIGDCVYELYIRTKLVNETKLKPHELHIKAIGYVKAKAQAEILKNIYDKLTEEEKAELTTLAESIHENDNNIILLAKLKH